MKVTGFFDEVASNVRGTWIQGIIQSALGILEVANTDV